MDRVNLLYALKGFTEETTKGVKLPVRLQKADKDKLLPSPDGSEQTRSPVVFLMRVPDNSSATKKAPYILHQIITGKDKQERDSQSESSATVRSIFCVYHEDGQEGGIALLQLIERWRIAVMKQRVIENRYEVDMEAGMEQLIYPDNTAPYYIGEVVSVWSVPPVERELTNLWLKENRLL